MRVLPFLEKSHTGESHHRLPSEDSGKDVHIVERNESTWILRLLSHSMNVLTTAHNDTCGCCVATCGVAGCCVDGWLVCVYLLNVGCLFVWLFVCGLLLFDWWFVGLLAWCLVCCLVGLFGCVIANEST